MTSQKYKEQSPLPPKEIFFHSKQIVITGGASGIGYALAEKLSKLGAHVLTVDNSPVKDLPEKVILINADVTDKSTLEKEIVLKNIDLLIIAAGVTSKTNNPTTEEQKLMKAVNVRGVKNTLDFFESRLVTNAQVIYLGSDSPPKAYYAETKKQGGQLVREFSEKNPDIVTQIIYLGPVRTKLFEKGKTSETIQRIQENVGLYEPPELAEELINKIVNVSNKNILQEEVMYKKLAEK